jgi:hypothetical protein
VTSGVSWTEETDVGEDRINGFGVGSICAWQRLNRLAHAEAPVDGGDGGGAGGAIIGGRPSISQATAPG